MPHALYIKKTHAIISHCSYFDSPRPHTKDTAKHGPRQRIRHHLYKGARSAAGMDVP